MKKTLAIVLAVLLSVFLFAGSGLAYSLDFNMDAVHPGTAQISYAGGNSALIGTDISVDSIFGLGTPLYDGHLLSIENGLLSFTTGDWSYNTADTWYFEGGGTITVTGGISSLGITNADTVLLSGIFNSAQVTSVAGIFQVTIASFIDDKNKDLLDFYGMDNVEYYGFMNLSFLDSGIIPPGAFTSDTIQSGDIVNTTIPDASAVFLLGSACLIGFVGLRRKIKGE